MMPSLKQLSYLRALSETGSFTQAAQKCNVTQSTLSAGIRELESLTGQNLFERTTRKVSLSPAGQLILGDACHILDLSAGLIEKLNANENTLYGNVRIGIIPTVATTVMPECLNVFHDEYPKAELKISENLTETLLLALENMQLDLAIIALPFSVSGNLETATVSTEELMIAIPKDHDLANKQTLKSQDLKSQTFIMLEDGHCLTDQAMEACSLNNDNVDPQFRCATIPTVISLVASGKGLSVIPKSYTGLFHAEDVVFRSLEKDTPTRDIVTVWRKSDPRRAAFQDFTEKLR